MKPILLYLLQVICCSGLLYGYYHLLLRNKKFHLYNRYYLLAAAVLSIIVPFLNIPVYFSGSDARPVWLQGLTDSSVTAYIFTGQLKHASPAIFTWNNILSALYILIALFISYRFIAAVLSIRKIIRKHKVEKLESVNFVNTEEKGTPFSFFRWLFWNKKIQIDSPEGQQILRHELFHIKQKHSFDIIFIEILTAIFWINPFFHLIKKELTTIHEFLADQFAANENEKWNYAELLLMHLLGSPNLRLTHPFFHNQIKRRIAMITSSQKPKYQYFRKVLVLPLLVVVAALFAFSYKQKMNDNNPQAATEVAIVEQPKIIEVALTDSPQIREIEIKRKDNGAVIEKFRIQSDIPGDGKSPLYVIDKVVIPVIRGNEAMKSLDPNQIESITVLKDKSAVDKYGPAAVNGVIEIITKNAKELKIVKGAPFQVVEDIKIVEGVPLQEVKEEVQTKNVVKGVQLKEVQIEDVPANKLSEVVVVGYAVKNVKDPAFPGGNPEWRKYLERNLNPMVPVDNGAPAGTYTVMAQFAVAIDGTISDIKTTTVHGYGMEEEVVRILKSGPRWTPGTVAGKAVSSFKKQPVTFMIEEETAGPKEAPVLDEVTVVGYGKPTSLKEINLDKLSPVYPNPATNSITIPYSTSTEGPVEIRIQDVNGKIYKTEKTTSAKGINQLNVDIASLNAGIYIITVTDANKNPAKIYKMIKAGKGR